MPDAYWLNLLHSLHNVWHVSLTLVKVDNRFDVSVDYLQTLMMIVALVLAGGFTVLVLLALYLCVVISFVPPVVWPPWWFRLTVAVLSIALVIVSSEGIDGSVYVTSGLDKFADALGMARELAQSVHDGHPLVTLAAAALNDTLTEAAACLGCFEVTNSTPVVQPNTTLWEVCTDLAVAPRILYDAVDIAHWTAAAPAQIQNVVHIVHASSGWQVWAAMLPLYALTLTAAAILVGLMSGRRNLLLLAQFVGVIVWWMMCAVISVEFAIAVGFADACGNAVDTTLRVLQNEAGHGDDRRSRPTCGTTISPRTISPTLAARSPTRSRTASSRTTRRRSVATCMPSTSSCSSCLG